MTPLCLFCGAHLPDKYRPNVPVTDDTAARLLDKIAEIAKGGRRKRGAMAPVDDQKSAEATFLASLTKTAASE